MATITKVTRKDGTEVYKARIRRQGRPGEITKRFKTRKAAERWAWKEESRIEEDQAGLASEARKRTLADAIKRYRRDILPKRSETTRPNYGRHLTFWSDELGHLKLASLSAAAIASARDKLAATPIAAKHASSAPKPRSPATVRRYLATLEAVCTACVRDWHWLTASPMKGVRMPEGADSKRTRFLSRDELKRLLAACKESESPDLYLAVVLAVTTGARRSEMMGIRWRDVDLERSIIRVRAETANAVKGGTRALPVPPQAAALLKARLEAFRKRSKVVDISARDDEAAALVFPSRVSRMQPVDLSRPFQTALRRARIEGFRWHDLRHSAASFLAANGASLLEIGAILGHKQAQTTARYSHLTEQASHARALLTAEELLGEG